MRLPGPCSDEGMSQCCHSTLWQQTSLATWHICLWLLNRAERTPRPRPSLCHFILWGLCQSFRVNMHPWLCSIWSRRLLSNIEIMTGSLNKSLPTEITETQSSNVNQFIISDDNDTNFGVYFDHHKYNTRRHIISHQEGLVKVSEKNSISSISSRLKPLFLLPG